MPKRSFLLADATIRLGLSLGASAEEHYKNGLRAACQQLALYPGATAINGQAIDQFVSTNGFQPGKELEQINTQLWVNYFLNGPEAYANLRRTGFPKLPSGYRTDGYSDADTKAMPRRLEYPLSEKSLNQTAVNGAIQRMGGKDDWNNRVWWDMQ